MSHSQEKPKPMKQSDKSSSPTSNRFPYDLVDEMIKDHLASINEKDETGKGKKPDS